MLVILYKVGKVSIHLLDTNGFHLQADNSRFIAAGLCCRETHKYENFASLFDRLHEKMRQKACRTCSTVKFSSFNQSYH